MKIETIVLLSTFLVVLASPVYADVHVNTNGSKVDVSVQENINSSNSNSYSNNVNSHTNITVSENTGDTSVHIDNNNFTISGTVKSVSGNTLNVSGQNIQFDPSKLSTPSVGSKVTVKGTVQNGVFNAISISSDGSSSSVLGTNTKAASPTPSPSSTVSPSSSAMSPSPSSSSVSFPSSPNSLLEELLQLFNKLFSIFK